MTDFSRSCSLPASLLASVVLGLALLGAAPMLADRSDPFAGGEARGGGPPMLIFTDVTLEAGVGLVHGYVDGLNSEARMATGGVTVGDYDGDGWLDLYAVSADIGTNALYRNRGDGTFEDVAAAAGVAIQGELGSGPGFFDYDGDGWLDLLVGGLEGTRPRLFKNLGDGTFEEVTAWSNIFVEGNTFSSGFGDIDLDGDVDIAFSHWNTMNSTEDGRIWRNDGAAGFTELKDADIGITGFETFDYSLAPTILDYDEDGIPDLLYSSDFGTSKIFKGRGDGTFDNVTTPVISDENGMGSAFGDYDGDGDLDWFVSSIWDPDQLPAGNWGVTGNRLYRNLGDGTFEDATTESGVREGYWGWAGCFIDFDHDLDLDLFHVNGFPMVNAIEFQMDPSRFFLSNGDGTFTETSVAVGIDDTRQGRGVVCFDYDRDGDVDIYIANNSDQARLYRNDSIGLGNSLTVAIRDVDSLNSHGLGARLTLVAHGQLLTRPLLGGSTYVSQQPQEVYFGLGDVEDVEELRIEFPDGRVEVRRNVAANQRLVVTAGVFDVDIPTLDGVGLWVLVGGLVTLAVARIRRRA
ncbi:MAG: CRTAC1 family protein [Acidobacteriota bacterium]